MIDSTSVVHSAGDLINVINAVIAAVVAVSGFIGGHFHGKSKAMKAIKK